LTLILGMLANKDPSGFLKPLAPLLERVVAIPVPDHACHAPASLADHAATLGIKSTATANDVSAALEIVGQDAHSSPDAPILIAGSLYLAGDVLARNRQLPT